MGRSPTLDELATAIDCTIEQTMEAIDAARNYHSASLDTTVVHDGEDRCALAETLGTEDDGFELADHRHALAASWSALSEVERRVLGLRLMHEMTQREISQRIGCSQMHVSRLLRRSMIRLNAAAALAS